MTKPGIVLIVVYIGRLPALFPLWLESCRSNPGIDWLIYTDDRTPYDYPPNVRPVYCNFAEIKDIFQRNFDFTITLDSVTKLCDYKTAYGDIFKEEIKDYGHWGYCDLDVIWGNLEKFIREYALLSYDKALDAGHFTLFRNTPEITQLYRKGAEKGLMDYKTVYTSPEIFAFDEWGGSRGVNAIFLAHGKSLFYEKLLFADIEVFSRNLQTTRTRYGDSIQEEKQKRKILYQYLNGSLYQHFTTGEPHAAFRREEMYIHLQKRNMVIPPHLSPNSFIIVPPNQILGREEMETLTFEVINRLGTLPGLYWANVLPYLKKRFITRIFKK